MLTRQEANNEILGLVAEDPFLKTRLEMLTEYIRLCPSQRFAQILCNYICSTYRDYSPDPEEVACLERLFPGNPDPFFEESVVTLQRLKHII